MAKEHSLSEFCKQHGQQRAADIIGCTQGNVSLMLSAKRNVFIVEDAKGRFSHYEIRRPKQSA